MDVRTISAEAPAWPRARVMSWIYGGLGALAVAMVLRYAVIEPHAIGIACAEDQVPWWCVARQGVVWLHLGWIWGALALVGGLSVTTLEWRPPARLGILVLVLAFALSYAAYQNVGLNVVWIWAALCIVAALFVYVANTLWTFRLALAMSLMALVLYNSDYGAVALALTLLRLPRA